MMFLTCSFSSDGYRGKKEDGVAPFHFYRIQVAGEEFETKIDMQS